jgi:hypothetical protein
MENQDPQLLSWRDAAKAIRSAFQEARKASNLIRVRKDWNQMIYCMHIMLEIEELISKSETRRQWIYGVTPLAQRFQEELWKVNENWAWTLAIQIHQLLRNYPVA